MQPASRLAVLCRCAQWTNSWPLLGPKLGIYTGGSFVYARARLACEHDLMHMHLKPAGWLHVQVAAGDATRDFSEIVRHEDFSAAYGDAFPDRLSVRRQGASGDQLQPGLDHRDDNDQDQYLLDAQIADQPQFWRADQAVDQDQFGHQDQVVQQDGYVEGVEGYREEEELDTRQMFLQEAHELEEADLHQAYVIPPGGVPASCNSCRCSPDCSAAHRLG